MYVLIPSTSLQVKYTYFLMWKWKSLSCVQLFETPMDYTVHGIWCPNWWNNILKMIQLLCDRNRFKVILFDSRVIIVYYIFFSMTRQNISIAFAHSPQFHSFIWVSGTYDKRKIIHLLTTVKLIWNALSPSPKTKDLFNFENLLIFMFDCKWLGFF